MSFSNNERRRVEEDERYRIYSREQHALRRGREGRERATKDEQRRQFVAQHGRDGAIRHTVRKWMLGAAIVSVIGFFVAIGDEGFLVAAKNALLCFIGWTAIGVVRAFYLVNSAR